MREDPGGGVDRVQDTLIRPSSDKAVAVRWVGATESIIIMITICSSYYYIKSNVNVDQSDSGYAFDKIVGYTWRSERTSISGSPDNPTVVSCS